MDILILNVLGGGSFILTCIALYMLSKQKSCGWIIFLPSYTLQMIIFYYTKQWFLLFQMIFLFAFSTYNYIKWEKDNGSIKH